MPSGIPVATVALNGAKNAGTLAAQILATRDDEMLKTVIAFKKTLKNKIVKANEELKKINFEYKA